MKKRARIVPWMEGSIMGKDPNKANTVQAGMCVFHKSIQNTASW